MREQSVSLETFANYWFDGECPKILYTEISDKMTYANSVDTDQTAFAGAVWSVSTLFAIPLSALKNCMKSKI